MNEVLSIPGVAGMMQAGVNLSPQVVQPQTRQAFDVKQDSPNKPAKKTELMKKKNLEKINQKKVDKLKNYFDDEEDWKETAEKIDKEISTLKHQKKAEKKREEEEEEE